MDRAARLLDAYVSEVVRLDERLRDAEVERDCYRELATVAIARLHRLTEIIRTQRRCLNDRTQERELAVHAELLATDPWLKEQLGRGDDAGEAAA